MAIVLVRAGLRIGVWSRWILLGALACAGAAQAAPSLSYRVIATRPHDSTAFTEGLAIDRGRLIESTGLNGRSTLVIRDLATRRLLNSLKLDDRDFGEGVAVAGRQIVQLTWKSGLGYLYDFALRRTGQFELSSEGWGLAYDGRQLIRSDGSSNLQLLDPRRFKETRRVTVRDGAKPIDKLNELEYANGRVYANVWLSDRIAVIDPRTGTVTGWLDLAALRQRFPKPAGWNELDYVLNGIAYDPASRHFLVTGKCWPVMYEIAIDGRRPAVR